MTENRSLTPGGRLDWERLYRGFADFYRVEASVYKLATLFNRLIH